MNNSFEQLFGAFSEEALHQAFKDCEIENVRISMGKKSIEIDAFFPLVVNYKIIEGAENALREKLLVNSVTIFPRMPAESFSEEYHSSLVFEAAPCHSPVKNQTTNRLKTQRPTETRLPPSGMYTYSRNQPPSVMCQRRQNSVMLFEMYG